MLLILHHFDRSTFRYRVKLNGVKKEVIDTGHLWHLNRYLIWEKVRHLSKLPVFLIFAIIAFLRKLKKKLFSMENLL